jgi:hypothetical protein
MKHETAAMPTSKGLQLKTIKHNPFCSRSLPTVGPSSRSSVTSASPASKPKATTLSSRPTSQASKRPTTLTETTRNVTPITALHQTQVSPGQKLGPESWTPITAAKVITSTPPPRLKVQKHRRPIVLPKDGSTPFFDPIKYKDIFYDAECYLPPSLSQAPSKALSPHTPPGKLPANNTSPKPALETRRIRSALSLPSRHLKRRARAVSKTVTWDPSIVSIRPEIHSNEEKLSEEDQKEVQINSAPEQVPTHKFDVKDCVETIKEWGKTDRSKLVSLIEALKQLELESEDRGQDSRNATSSNEHNEGVLITTVKSLDPRVPDFHSSGIAEAKRKMNRVEEPEIYRTADSNLNLFLDFDRNKENLPELPLQPATKLRDNAVSKTKKIVILDDYSSPGREVDSFDHWYGELQLMEFAKRYPLTGRRASAVRQLATTSAGVARASKTVRSVSGGSEVAARDVRRGERVSDTREVESRRKGEKGDALARNAREDDYAGRKHVRHRRRDIPPADPLARKNAAVIQQRLEMLLLKERERKALEGMPEKTKSAVRKLDGGLLPWAGSLQSGELGCEVSNSGLVWVPSERLRLSRA